MLHVLYGQTNLKQELENQEGTPKCQDRKAYIIVRIVLSYLKILVVCNRDRYMYLITHEQAANMASKVLGIQSLNKTRKARSQKPIINKTEKKLLLKRTKQITFLDQLCPKSEL